MPLTNIKIQKATAPKNGGPLKLTDGNGLYIEIRPNGSKLWRYRYRIDGKENVFALGQYFNDKHHGHLSLEEARTERDKARQLVKRGIHPAHHRKTALLNQHAENANTFQTIAKEWIESKKARWSAYYLRQVERFMATDVFPLIGASPIRSITTPQVIDVIRRTQRRAPSVATLLRQWISQTFQYAIALQRTDANPAADLKRLFERPKVKHHKPLSSQELTQLLKALESDGGYRTTNIALLLMALTFVRTIELRGAAWTEFNLDAAEWRIPPERMKMRQAHLVPLSHQAVTLLRELQTHTGGREYLFPNYRSPGTHMSATTLNRALERLGFTGKDSIGFSAHGFRATASTTLHEMGFNSDVIERQLAHAERNTVRASYNHAEYLVERKKMMQHWADHLDRLRIGGNVVAGSFGKVA